jgi:uncharacterized tellurite resistance protein B-like protein
MNNPEKHLETLVHFARVDGKFNDEEKTFLRHIGKRLQLPDATIAEVLDAEASKVYNLPDNEVLRYILFDDILNLLVSDRLIDPVEIEEVRKLAVLLGFEASMADEILTSLERFLANGLNNLEISHEIKNSIFSITNKMMPHEKYRPAGL